MRNVFFQTRSVPRRLRATCSRRLSLKRLGGHELGERLTTRKPVYGVDAEADELVVAPEDIPALADTLAEVDLHLSKQGKWAEPESPPVTNCPSR